MTEESTGPALMNTNQCIVSGCSVELPFRTGSTCNLHKEEGAELLSNFGAGIPGYDIVEEDPRVQK